MDVKKVGKIINICKNKSKHIFPISKRSLFLAIILIVAFYVFLIKLPTIGRLIFGSKAEPAKKILILGMDGAEWKVINSLIEEGKLPQFEKFKKVGSYGYLKTPHDTSPVSWTDIATGKAPDKHGIYKWKKEGFGMFGKAETIVSGADVKSKRIWNILNDHNETTGIYRWLLTWPVEEVSGFMISGWLAKNETIFYPKELREIFYTEHIPIHDPIKNLEWDEYFSGIVLTLLKEFDLDFYAFIYYTPDKLQHLYWKYWEPEKFNITDTNKIKKYRNLIADAYKEIDDLLKELGDDWVIFIVSDSGFKAKDQISYDYLNFNPILRDLGLLNVSSYSSYLASPGPNSKIYQCSSPYLDLTTGLHNVYFCFTNGSINKQNISKIIAEIKYSGTDEEFFTEIWLVDNNKLKLLFNTRSKNFELRNQTITLSLPSGKEINFNVGPGISGHHPPGTDGILLVKGPMIKENYKIKNATVYDIAPTILYLKGYPIPEDMDGKVLTEIIKPSFLLTHPIRYTKESSQWEKEERFVRNETMEEQIKKRLRELGYL